MINLIKLITIIYGVEASNLIYHQVILQRERRNASRKKNKKNISRNYNKKKFNI